MAQARTKKAHERYMRYIAKGFLAGNCNLCEKKYLIKEFKHWRIVKNLFPYDRIAKIHHMITPKRHVTEKRLNQAERKEYESIKHGYIQKNYEFIMEGTDGHKSIPKHFHLHLITVKP